MAGIWYRKLLLPFSFIYGAVVWVRNSLYDQGVLRPTGFPLPTISVGNITVGGTGKTPHVEYLVELLQDQFKLATLSRGYLRKTRDFRIASEQSTTREVGDEPMQIKRRFPNVTVAVDRKRVNGIGELMKLAPSIEAIILDDAFQHRSLKVGFSILLIDYTRPILKDLLLPAGNLRENPRSRDRANIILVTKSPADLKPIEMREYVNRIKPAMGQHLYFTTMKMGDLYPVFGQESAREQEWFRDKTRGILVISGVVNPASLMDFAREIHSDVRAMTFRDHHRYDEKDILRIVDRLEEFQADARELLILTTEKDGVKLCELNFPAHLKSRIWAVRLKVKFLNNGEAEFKKQILNYVTSNKRSSILYQGENK